MPQAPFLRWAILAGAMTALLAAGCGGSGTPERSALASELAALCDRARDDTEALGLPGDKGFSVVPPTAVIGQRLGKDIGALEGTTARETTQLRLLAKNITYYYGEMAAGAKLYNVGQHEAYVLTMERAKPTLVAAEKTATSLGAPECAERPFSE